MDVNFGNNELWDGSSDGGDARCRGDVVASAGWHLEVLSRIL